METTTQDNAQHSVYEEALAQTFGADFAKNFDDPLLPLTVSFNNQVARQFMKRDFPMISRILFLEIIYRRRYKFDQNVLNNFSEIVTRRSGEICAAINLELNRINKLIELSGVSGEIKHLRATTMMIPIIANGARIYVEMLRILDEAYSALGTAFLNGVLDGHQRAEGEKKVRKLVRAFAAMIRAESIKVRKEAVRARNDGLPTDASDASVVESAEKAFDESLATASTEGEDGVEAGNAADIIDEITATAAAAAGGRVKKKPKNDAPHDVSPDQVQLAV